MSHVDFTIWFCVFLCVDLESVSYALNSTYFVPLFLVGHDFDAGSACLGTLGSPVDHGHC